MIDHLIFDFDGTISDSYPIFSRIVYEIAEKHGIKITVDRKEVDRLLKITVNTFYTFLNWEQYLSNQNFFDEFHLLQRRYYCDFKPFPEAIALLKQAEKMGKKLYIYTHSDDIVYKMLENMGIDHMFSYVLSANQGFPSKPAPDALLFMAKELNLDPARCMMIGDRPIDAQAGMNAGMKGCLWDPDNKYSNIAFDYRIPSLLDILDFA